MEYFNIKIPTLVINFNKSNKIEVQMGIKEEATTSHEVGELENI